MSKIKVAIADDHNLFRRGMVSIMKEFTDLEVVIEAANGRELLEKISRGPRPHVVLLDIKMPELDGVRTTKHLRAAYPTIRIIILTMHDEKKFMTHLVELGVNGYLLKDSEPDEVERAIREVAGGGRYMANSVIDALNKNPPEKTHLSKLPIQVKGAVEYLTEREQEVLILIGKEYTTQEIAEKLCLSARTIEGYRQRLMEKTQTKNAVGMVAFAIENGLLKRKE